MSDTTIQPTVDIDIDVVNRLKFTLEQFQHKTRWVVYVNDLEENVSTLCDDIIRVSEQFEGLIGAVHAVKQTRDLESLEARRLTESLYGEINKFRMMTKGARRALKAASQLALAVEELSDALSDRDSELVRARRDWLASPAKSLNSCANGAVASACGKSRLNDTDEAAKVVFRTA